ncbi:MAG: hypothetical protein WB987_12815 [Candidatus Acidiferrales bacterium]
MNAPPERRENTMYHYDPKSALDELRDDAVLPHPVHLRDMILRTKLDPTTALDLNREFQDYLTRFGELQKVAREILERIAAGARKASAS